MKFLLKFKYSKLIKHIKTKFLIKYREKIFKEEVKYLYIPHESETLLIVFSGFTGKKRKYNYISSFASLKVNQLYILDTWGVEGSYYWLDHGSDRPEKLVNELIDNIIMKAGVTHVITAGSSKGGTAAIYYGLLHSAEHIFSGANQFYVGNYLNEDKHQHILKGMSGLKNTDDVIEYLNQKLLTVIEKNANNKGLHLFYSSKEPTYKKEIIPLKACLENNCMLYKETVKDFSKHSDVGIFFPAFVLHELENYRNINGVY